MERLTPFTFPFTFRFKLFKKVSFLFFLRSLYSLGSLRHLYSVYFLYLLSCFRFLFFFFLFSFFFISKSQGNSPNRSPSMHEFDFPKKSLSFKRNHQERKEKSGLLLNQEKEKMVKEKDKALGKSHSKETSLSLLDQSKKRKTKRKKKKRRQQKIQRDQRKVIQSLSQRSGKMIQKFSSSFPPFQEIIILNTEKGFVPSHVRIFKGSSYKIYIVNVNEEQKNVSFVMSHFSKYYGTYYGKEVSFDFKSNKEGIFSFQSPETEAEGWLIVLPERSHFLHSLSFEKNLYQSKKTKQMKQAKQMK